MLSTVSSIQNTTPIRSGQRQGYVVSVFNPTNVTQTIVGDASGEFGPPQSRLMRVLWTSHFCLGNGEGNGIGTLSLPVRVGWFTRTERIPQQEWYLVGPSQGRCSG